LALLKKLGTLPYRWVGHSSRIQWLVVLVGIAVSLPFFSRRRGVHGWSAWAGMWLLWSMGSVAVSWIDSSVSYVLVVPSLAAAAAGLIAVFSTRGEAGLFDSIERPRRLDGRFIGVATIAPLLAVLPLWVPVAWLFYDGLGISLVVTLAAVAALVGSTVSPLMRGAPSLTRLAGVVSAVAALVLFVVCAFAKPFTLENPRHLNLGFHLDATARRAWWELDQAGPDLPPALTQVASFSQDETSPLPWLPRYKVHVAPAPLFPLAQPELRVAENVPTKTGRRVRARLVSRRNAPEAGIAVPSARIRSLTMEGRQLPSSPKNRRKSFSAFSDAGLSELRCVTLPPEGVEISIEISGAEPLVAFVWDASPGLPPQGRFLLEARPKDACPVQNGDETLVSHQISL
jgi:hypothetical protein